MTAPTVDLTTVDLLGARPTTPSPQEILDAITALSHLLHGETDKAYEHASRLSPATCTEVVMCLGQFAQMLFPPVVAMAALTPDALPDGVEGIHVGGRR